MAVSTPADYIKATPADDMKATPVGFIKTTGADNVKPAPLMVARRINDIEATPSYHYPAFFLTAP
ncbi:hypothetical protein EV682_103378 [Iodobacter fluviatilis]|uniref:Uncharacterized protein n=1 Tax=Iodobacter fluviatilis TaxID=537 RepID=A0A377Q793_9NEIS|nr:hypothetical protein EV682_103378 [Iodobacter fluviatilis]STQ91134.1 Uncharacterised protein [Iodobacter fluviatilis]